jgi:hypothetical protein
MKCDRVIKDRNAALSGDLSSKMPTSKDYLAELRENARQLNWLRCEDLVRELMPYMTLTTRIKVLEKLFAMYLPTFKTLYPNIVWTDQFFQDVDTDIALLSTNKYPFYGRDYWRADVIGFLNALGLFADAIRFRDKSEIYDDLTKSSINEIIYSILAAEQIEKYPHDWEWVTEGGILEYQQVVAIAAREDLQERHKALWLEFADTLETLFFPR